jgi:hypothetical protein
MEREGSLQDQPPAPIVNHINQIHTVKLYFPEMHFNIILPSKPRCSEWSVLLRLSNQNFVPISYLPHARICPAHLNLIWSS